ncbi:hypothetical protein DIPPA_33786 [Diplonema papillatum]|nr:hypothetical protein DIPPA_33786 [Diplonema papillatum]
MPKQLDRSGAVSWVKRVVGTDVPSLFSFTANNRRLSTVLKVAREVEGTAEAGLRHAGESPPTKASALRFFN